MINLCGLIAMLMDKQRAIRKQWRIPEKTLFGLAILGASLGTIIGMHLFKHKTKHLEFRFGLPIILIIQTALTYLYVIYK